jgi:putative nucleotidyltransferase with HDIG domain
MEQGELFVVGGVVRDALIGAPAGDEDADYLVRGVPPEALERILAAHGRLAFVGKSFGVYKFRPPGKSRDIDIAYPRSEVSTGPGHREFEVDWDWRKPIEDDLGRRDFTINAMARNLRGGEIVDPCRGAEDIRDRVLRMVFPGAFREDPLRILRGIRFAARFSLRIEKETYAAMEESAPLVDTLSPERVQEEFTKLLTQCDRPSEGLSLMRWLGVMERLLPELARAHGIEQNEYHPDDVFWHSLRSCDAAPKKNLLVRWAALLHDVGKVDRKQTIEEDGKPKVIFYGHETESAAMAESVLKRLRYGNDFVRRCAHLIEMHMFLYRREWNRSTVRRFIGRVGEEHIGDLFVLRRADCLSRGMTGEVEELEDLRSRIETELREARAFKVSDLAIDGADVKDALGLPEGPEIGRILGELFENVVDDPSLNTREALLDELRRRYGSGSGAPDGGE